MEPRPYGFSHQLFAADAGKIGELVDAFSTVVRVFEFLPLLRFRSTHLAGWLRRRFERMVTPRIEDQRAVIARTQLLLPRLAAIDVPVDRFRGDVEGLDAMVPMGAVHLARWEYVTGTTARLERLAELRGPVVMLEDFMGNLVDMFHAIATHQPYEPPAVEPPPESFEYSEINPLQLGEALHDCVELCLDPWPENLGVGAAFDAEPEVQQAVRATPEPYALGTPTPWEMTHNPHPRCALHHYDDAPGLWRPGGLLPDRLLVDPAAGASADFRRQYPKPIPCGEAGGQVCVAMPGEVEAFLRQIDTRAEAPPRLASLLPAMKQRCQEAARAGQALVGWIEFVERDDA